MAPDITKLIEAAESVWENNQLGFAAEVRSAPISEKKVGDDIYELKVVMSLKTNMVPYKGGPIDAGEQELPADETKGGGQ